MCNRLSNDAEKEINRRGRNRECRLDAIPTDATELTVNFDVATIASQ